MFQTMKSYQDLLRTLQFCAFFYSYNFNTFELNLSIMVKKNRDGSQLASIIQLSFRFWYLCQFWVSSQMGIKIRHKILWQKERWVLIQEIKIYSHFHGFHIFIIYKNLWFFTFKSLFTILLSHAVLEATNIQEESQNFARKIRTKRTF